MATALQGFRLTVQSCQCRPHAQRYITRSIGRRRAFSTAPPLLKLSPTRGDYDSESRPPSTTRHSSYNSPHQKKLSLPELEVELKAIIDREGSARRGADEGRITEDIPDVSDESRQEMRAELFDQMREHGIAPPEGPTRKKKLKLTFLNRGEEEPFETDDFDVESDTFQDMTTLAHGELEHHREMRHYARLAAWEMPLLSKFAKPFVPPTIDQPLRFRYTTYMGEQHPAEKKVVMEFCTRDMRDLTPVQRSKLQKIAGVRYNPETDIVRMSCESLPSQAQNKRYLGDLVNNMLREARDPTDTFEDVPYDMRHHNLKLKPRFPKAWKMTSQRQADLKKLRENAELRDQRRLLTGQLVDGIKVIEEAFSKVAAQPAALPEMVIAGKSGKGKGKKVAVRR